MKKTFALFEKLPCDCEVRGHCMHKEMPVFPVNTVVDKKRIIRKNGGQGGQEAQGVAAPPHTHKKAHIGM
jgi:hypothetical protein